MTEAAEADQGDCGNDKRAPSETNGKGIHPRTWQRLRHQYYEVESKVGSGQRPSLKQSGDGCSVLTAAETVIIIKLKLKVKKKESGFNQLGMRQ